MENQLKKTPVIVMHMSGAYLKQSYYRDASETGAGRAGHPVLELDCREIAGTNCYCDEQAKEQLRERISQAGAWEQKQDVREQFKETPGAGTPGIHFLDSGNYHYLSLLWMEHIREPFSLVVFDKHPDMLRPAFGDITSCGGWVREALETNPFLEKVYLVGIAAKLWDEVREQLSQEPEGAELLERVELGEEALLSRRIYLSLDKDVLRQADARCDWDQGDMTLDELLERAKRIAAAHEIIGVDVCGERPESGSGEDIRVNDRTNRKLLEAAVGWLAGC